MTRIRKFLVSVRSAFLLSFVFVVMGTAYWLSRVISIGALNVDRDPGPWTIIGGLAGVVLATYLGLAALGYRVSASGDVKAPRLVTWFVAALATVVVMGAVLGALLSK
jgi:hypothetical protein